MNTVVSESRKLVRGLEGSDIGRICLDNRILISSLERKQPSLEEAYLGATTDHVAYRSA